MGWKMAVCFGASGYKFNAPSVMLGFGPGLKSRNEKRGEEMEAGRLEGIHRGTSRQRGKEMVECEVGVGVGVGVGSRQILDWMT
jgi:hypothetical protein